MRISTIVTGTAPANDPVRLAVIEADGAWRIYLDGQKVGRFSRHGDALQCALDIARETRADGRPVEVLSQSAFGQVTVLDDRLQAC